MNIGRLLSEHSDWTDQQIADAANQPVYHDIPLPVMAALLVGYKPTLRAIAADLMGGASPALGIGINALVDAVESPHLRVIEASRVAEMHSLAARVAQIEPTLTDLAEAVSVLGVTRSSYTAADVARRRLIDSGRAAYDAAQDRLAESFNSWLGRVERGEINQPWSE